jgi:hypothetical protein
MKPNQLVQPLWMRILLFAFLLFAVTMISKRSAANILIDEEKKPKKEKATTASAVKVFPDAFKKAMHVVAKSGNQKDVTFYVFNSEGVMVLNYKLKKGEKKIIGLPKGNYTYQAFCDDVAAGAGKMQFR